VNDPLLDDPLRRIHLRQVVAPHRGPAACCLLPSRPRRISQLARPRGRLLAACPLPAPSPPGLTLRGMTEQRRPPAHVSHTHARGRGRAHFAHVAPSHAPSYAHSAAQSHTRTRKPRRRHEEARGWGESGGSAAQALSPAHTTLSTRLRPLAPQRIALPPDVLNTAHATLTCSTQCMPPDGPVLHSPRAGVALARRHRPLYILSSIARMHLCMRSVHAARGGRPHPPAADLHAERVATTLTPPKIRLSLARHSRPTGAREAPPVRTHARPLVCSCALSAATHRPSPQTPSPQTPESADARGGGANAEGARPSRKRRGRRPRVQTPWA